MTDQYRPQAIYTKEPAEPKQVVRKSAVSKKNILIVLGLTSFIVLVMASVFLAFRKQSTTPTKPKADVIKEASCTLSFVVASPSPTPSVSPTPTPSVSPSPTPTPTPSPSPAPGCNDSCANNTECTNQNSSWICSSTYGNVCRLASYPSSESCTPPPTPSPSPSPYRGCNDTCTYNSDCSANNLICYYGRCRLDSYPDSDRCIITTVQQQVVTQQVVQQQVQTVEKGGQPEMPAELPKTGIFDVKILGAGAALTIIGMLILVIL